MSVPPAPSGNALQDGRRLSRILLVVIATTYVLRMIIGGQLHLAEDEAYYRLWSLSPDLGYYDHPPMIAWWIWLGRALLGDTPLGVRLLPILACAATSLLVVDMARLVGASARAAALAGIWFNAMPLVALGGILATPDAAASLFWTLTLCCVFRAVRDDSVAWWFAGGIAAGLAALSKYTGLFLAPGIVLWLLLTPQGRHLLLRPGPWVAALAAAALFSVNLLWNADHHWVTFAKQFGRLAANGLAPGHVVEFLGGQALLLNPFLAAFLVMALVGHLKSRTAPSAVLTPLMATSAPFALYLLTHSLHDRVEAHWAAPLYPVLAICAAVYSMDLMGLKFWRGLARATPTLGFGACAAAIVWLAASPWFAQGAADFALPLRGWSAFAGRLDVLRRASGAHWVATTSYGLAAQLAGEQELRSPVFQISERQRYADVDDEMGPDTQAPGLVIDLPRRLSIPALQRCFTEVLPLGSLVRGAPAETGQAYVVARVKGPKVDLLHEGCWNRGKG